MSNWKWRWDRLLTGLLASLAILTPGSSLAANAEALGFERTPPRVSLVEGDVSFFRAGAPEWSAAEVNTPLAAGDDLYAAVDSQLEVQIGPRAYLRADEETQVGLTSLEPDFLQLRISEGSVSLDLRTLTASQTFEIDTPRAAFTIERSGYYRFTVTDDATTFVARRGGRARVTAAHGITSTVAASEQLVIRGAPDAPQLETYAAPELDDWDRWNYARTDSQLEAVSARYVPSSVYGAYELDQYGDWRVVASYGAVWVPRGVAVGWAPYTAGRWIHDPYYGWSWVDAAPWGWAPYHYGRWVRVSGYWAWAPGPLVVRAYYAPALVAFFGSGSVRVGVSLGGPRLGWLALGWGEPIVPWWGPAGFRGVPRWAGWGGPRVVNRVVVRNTVVVRARDIHEYEHRRTRNSFVAVDRKDFGRRGVRDARVAADVGRYRRLDDLDVRPGRESLDPSGRTGRRPPWAWQERAVVATRAPRPSTGPRFEDRDAGVGAPRAGRETERRPAGGAERRRAGPERARVVEPSREAPGRRALERPPFGTRGEGERTAPPPPPRYRAERTREPRATAARPAPERTPEPRATAARPAPERRRAAAKRPGPRKQPMARAPAPPGRQTSPTVSATPGRGRDLPGEPASRVYRQRERRPRDGGAAVSGRPEQRAPRDRSDRRSRGGGRDTDLRSDRRSRNDGRRDRRR